MQSCKKKKRISEKRFEYFSYDVTISYKIGCITQWCNKKNYFLGFCVKKKSQRVSDDGTSAGDLYQRGKCEFCSHVWDLCWYSLEGIRLILQKMDTYKQQIENQQQQLKPITGFVRCMHHPPLPDVLLFIYFFISISLCVCFFCLFVLGVGRCVCFFLVFLTNCFIHVQQ